LEQTPQMTQQTLAIGAVGRVGMFSQKTHITDQVRQAKLSQDAPLANELMVSAIVVAPQDALELLAENFVQNLSRARWRDFEDRERSGAKTPGPEPLAAILMPGLIHVQHCLIGEQPKQLLIRIGQRRGGLGDQLGKQSATDPYTHDISEELADRRVGSMAGTLQEPDQRGQPWADQASRSQLFRQSGIMHLTAVGTPSRMQTMFADLRQTLGQFGMLMNPHRQVVGRLQGSAAAGTNLSV